MIFIFKDVSRTIKMSLALLNFTRLKLFHIPPNKRCSWSVLRSVAQSSSGWKKFFSIIIVRTQDAMISHKFLSLCEQGMLRRFDHLTHRRFYWILIYTIARISSFTCQKINEAIYYNKQSVRCLQSNQLKNNVRNCVKK